MNTKLPDKLKKDLEKLELEYEAGRYMYYYFNYMISERWAELKKGWGIDVCLVGDCKNHMTKFYLMFSEKTFEDFVKKIANTDFLEKFEKKITNIKDNSVKKLKNTDPLKLSNKELIDFIKNLYICSKNIYGAASILRSIDRGVNNLLKDLLINKKDKEELLYLISFPNHPSFSNKEAIDLLRLAVKVRNKNIDSKEAEKELRNIKEEYCCISLGNYVEKPKLLKDYKKDLNHILEDPKIDPGKLLKDIENKRSLELSKREKVLENLDDFGKSIAKIISKSASLKDDFKFFINKIHYLSTDLFNEISKRSGKPLSFIKDLSPEEMYDLIKGKKIGLKDRKKDYVIIGYDNKIITLSKEKADSFRNKFLKSNFEKEFLEYSNSEKKEFKGRSASPGFGKGKARIILNSREFNKFEKGDILISLNTTPDYVPIMKKAAAIVTEEGGLTAHVSVVSRELGIPCIVGIRNITKILKDNDLVEVDADKGIVKIIKKAKNE